MTRDFEDTPLKSAGKTKSSHGRVMHTNVIFGKPGTANPAPSTRFSLENGALPTTWESCLSTYETIGSPFLFPLHLPCTAIRNLMRYT